MYKQAQFWNFMAKRYANSAIADEAAYKTKLAKTQEYFSPTSKVLEFGCGTGSTAIIHAPYVGEYVATDISANMLAIAKDKAASAKVNNLAFQQTSLADFTSAPASWDAVLGLSVLHLVPDRIGDLKRAYNLLKPGGVFILSCPCIGDMQHFFKYIAPVFKILPFLPSVSVFTSAQLLDQIRSAGFKIEYQWRPNPDAGLFIVARKPVN